MTTILLAWVLAAAPASVTFQINDSYVKDKVLPGVDISVARTPEAPPLATGRTDAQGRFAAPLEPGKYVVTYKAPHYVPIENSPVVVGAEPQTITTTMTMMLEDAGQASSSRIQVVLNWGSARHQVKDADSHLLCSCGGDSGHVYYQHKVHRAKGHSAELDVDDTDWAGPETITLLNAPAGTYHYWVHNYSGESDPGLGGSAVVVRVVLDDAVAGEYRIPTDLSQSVWWPFKELVVDPTGAARIVPFSAEELTRGDDRAPASELDDRGLPEGTQPPERGSWCGVGFVAMVLLVALAMVGRFASRARKRRN